MTRHSEPDPDVTPRPSISNRRTGAPREPEFDEGLQAGQGRHLLDYVRALYRRRWVVLTTFVTVVLLMAVQTFTTTPIYEASAQLLIETAERNVLTFKDVMEQDRTALDYAQTQHRLLRSRVLARQTLDALKLWDQPPFGGASTEPSFSLTGAIRAPFRWMTQRFSSAKTSEPAATDETIAQSAAIDAFLAGVSIAPIRNSQLVDVKFRSPDPVLAARVANELVKQFIAQTQELKFKASKETSGWLAQQLEEQRKHVEASELALQQYREEQDAVSLDDRQNIVVQKLADLNGAVTKAKMKRIERESEYNQLRSLENSPESLDTFPAILANGFIQQLKSELSQLEAQQAQLGEKLGGKHPDMIKVASAIESARVKLDAEIAKVVQSVRNEYLAAQAEEESLMVALNAQKNDALAQNRKGINYGALQRDAATNRQLFEGLLQRAKETGVSGELKPTNIRIVDSAEVPRSPVLPRRRSDLLMAVLAGGVLAVGFALFLEYLDNRIKSPEEIIAHLGMPCLGLVPMIADKALASRPLINNGVPANFSEAFRGLRTNVLFSSTEEDSRSLVVTSTGPGEGKTIVATNLALALAQSGQRVILIDADMRRPRTHEVLDQKQEPGLSNLIVGNAKATKAVRPSSVPGLWVLPAGRIPPNPAELLGSARFKDFLVKLRDHFDWVILDSPPVMAVTDAAVVAHLTNGVVFVVGSEMANRGAARTAVNQLEAADAKLLGAVLNRVNLRRDGYYYSNYYQREYDSYHAAVS
jgi:succinoglycan biosynthesis transport protein ExoP